MVTWRPSHKIESLGDDGVGSSVGVGAGSGVCVVAVVDGVEDDPFSVEQAIRTNNGTSSVDNNFFMGELRFILIRRTDLFVSSRLVVKIISLEWFSIRQERHRPLISVVLRG